MSVNFLPSLQHLAIVKAAVAVFTNHEVMEFEKKLRITTGCSFFNAERIAWEPFLWKKISLLSLPVVFQKKVLALMMPFSFEYWMYHYDHHGRFKNDLCCNHINHIVWNSFGMIDRFKTAERCGHSPDLAILQHETIAPCFGRRMNMFERFEFVKMRKTDDLLQKITLQRDLNLLINTIKINRRISNNERICLFNLNNIQQDEFFLREPLLILKVLLQWPLQSQFLEVADRLWAHLKEADFVEILSTILCKIKRVAQKLRVGFGLLKKPFPDQPSSCQCSPILSPQN
ncbi:hypothetical protein TNCV_2057751 [Trichonephila clavipes]|nr:hypothetical protein TNCV_2057751 [Trichonephila clavipes]